eukprot:c2827_g1_i1.p1 GENE.c2827_g1_i1~~c2827_g1_i1.p1  ORF type:complete len:397 (-),score=89.75 c2827_g1_i1:65-1255(-)
MSLNIGGSADDEFFRYTMPPIEVKIEGRGNGIKTVITNMNEIGTALKRDPEYPTKYFATELGALSKWDEARNVGIVNGEHRKEILQKLLGDFISRYVLCAACKNPETELKVKKDGTIRAKCLACGHSFDSDNKHKLAVFIRKHPPPSSKTAAGSSSSSSSKSKGKDKEKDKDKSEKKSKEKRREKDKSKGDDDKGSDGSDDNSKPEKEKTSSAVEDDGDIDFVVTDEMRNMKVNENTHIDDPIQEMLDALNQASDVEGRVSAIQELQARKGFSDVERLQYVFKALIQDKLAKQIEENADLIEKVMPAGREGQWSLLALIEERCETFPLNLKGVAKSLQTLYDKDILEEVTILDWHVKGVSQVYALADERAGVQAREASQVFIEWLRNAEEESDSDD